MESEVTPDDLYAALVPLKAAPLADPEHRPDGPTAADLAPLLGILTSQADRIAAAANVTPDNSADFVNAYIGHAMSNGDMALLMAQLAVRLRLTSEWVADLNPRPGSKADMWDTLRSCVHAATSVATLIAAQQTATPEQFNAMPSELLRVQLRSAKRSLKDARRHYEAVLRDLRDEGYTI